MINLNISNISKYILISLVIATILSEYSYGQKAENTNLLSTPKDISFQVRVINATSLISGKTNISLWGIETIKTNAAIFDLKVRGALEKKINGKAVLCTIKTKTATNTIKAQCINHMEEDLSLFLLQNGFVSADRAAIYGSIYEKPYLKAEQNAQIAASGAWENMQNNDSSSDTKQSKNFMMASVLLMAVFVLALGVITFYIMRGFKRVVDIQNHSIHLATKERSLKDKEKYVIASMLDAEIRSNKSKIEAYLTIYEDTLQQFNTAESSPTYQKTGDIIQKQPALDRSVFDGNTDKLDLFGARLASNIIHYYARIKTTPDYVEIKTTMPPQEVQEILARLVASANKLKKISDQLSDDFIQYGLIKPIENI